MENEELKVRNSIFIGISCPTCFTVNDDLARFCQKCNFPLGSTLDPLAMAQDEGRLLGKTTQTRPKLIVLFVVWLIFLPIFLVSSASAVNLILSGGGTSDFMFFWFCVVMFVVSFYFIYQVTLNYLRGKNK